MPFRSEPIFTPNTLYNFMPPEVWDKEEWNRSLQQCNRFGLRACAKFIRGETFNMQFRPGFVPGNLMPDTELYSGNITATAAGKATATGIGLVSEVNQLIYNGTTGQSTYITAIDSANVVSVQDDIFLSGNTAAVYDYKSNNGFKVESDQELGILFCRESQNNLSTLTLTGSIVSLDYYYIKVYVSNYTGGTLEVKVGTEIIGTITANGIHEFYGRANGVNIVFETSAAQDFVGCLQLSSFESYTVREDYLTGSYSENMTLFLMENVKDKNDYQIVNGVISFNQSPDIGFPCSCGYYTIEDPYNCKDGILTNSDFTTFDDWTSSNPGTVNWDSTNESLQFKDALSGQKAFTSSFNCPIVCGLIYTIQFEVAEYIGGNVLFNVGGTQAGVNITGNGSYSFDVEIGEDCTQIFEVIAALGGADLDITEINVQYKTGQSFIIATSELVCVCDLEPCEVQILFRNDVDAFGYVYPEGLYNKLVFCGRLRNNIINFNSFENNKDTFGIYSAYYADVDAVEEFVTEWIPPYQARALTVALAHSEVLINGVSYILKSTFTAQSNDDSEMVKVIASVVKKDQRYTFMTRR
jgi:hypothetical protein